MRNFKEFKMRKRNAMLTSWASGQTVIYMLVSITWPPSNPVDLSLQFI